MSTLFANLYPMENFVKLEDFGQVVATIQGEASDAEFARNQNLTRQTIRNVKLRSHMASKAFVEHFGWELGCRPKPPTKKKATKRST